MSATPSDSPESTPDQTTPEAPLPESAPETAPAATPEPEPAPAAEPEAEVTAEPEVAAENAPTPEAEPEVAPEAQSAVAAEAEPEVVTEAPAEGETPAEPAVAPEGEPAAAAEGEPAAAAEGEPAAAAEGEPAAAAEGEKAKKKKKKPTGPDPAAIVKRIGSTSEAALAYVQDPDPKLARMSRKHREAVISEIPPVTAGALLGPDALCRHFLASAAAGRYKDLFFLWELFKLFPEDCKPVLASRQRAQEKARNKMRTATHLGLLGSADRVADDIERAAGLPWRWMQEILEPMGPAIRQRPVVLAAVLRRDPSFDAAVPEEPSDRWLAEAAALRESGKEVPEVIDSLLGKFADRLPATLATLQMTQSQYPDRVPALIDRIDLRAKDIHAMLAWARDHGHGDQLHGRIAADVAEAATASRSEGLARWKAWGEHGVEVEMPETLSAPTLDGLDLGRPESAELIKRLIDAGADMNAQTILDGVAADNRMLGEKAYESFVCAGFDGIHLPLALEGNPMVRPETRCQACQAWTWVRPGHETRCPHDGMPFTSAPEQDAAAAVDAAVSTLAPVADEAGAAPAPAGERPSAPPPPSATPATPEAPAATPTPEAPAPSATDGADAWTDSANEEA